MLGYEASTPTTSAIGFALEKYGTRPNVTFRRQLCRVEDVAAIQPSRVLLCGLLHHLSDEQALELFAALRASSRLRRIVTSDIVYLDGGACE